jgi:hypothetical protein
MLEAVGLSAAEEAVLRAMIDDHRSCPATIAVALDMLPAEVESVLRVLGRGCPDHLTFSRVQGRRGAGEAGPAERAGGAGPRRAIIMRKACPSRSREA